jgi:HTH-type transcriptional regulator/antitoxin HigA
MIKASKLKALYGKRQDRYLELINAFPLRPLASDRELDAAVEVMDQLLDQPRLSRPERDYLDVLSDLVEAYEAQNLPEPAMTDGDVLQSLLDMKDLSQTQLARHTGIAESTISEVLKGKRRLNRRHITKLSSFFSVSSSVFLQDEASS